MRNSIRERYQLLTDLGGLPAPEVTNQEWLYLIKEETRNSIMIEGVFVSEEELEEVLAGGRPLKRSQEEALNYYRTALFSYGLAYENYKSGQLLFGIPLIRQMNKTIAEKGDFRKGDSRIAGAKVVPPPGLLVGDWMAFFEKHIEQGFDSKEFLRFLTKQHILFETIHPFEDGNGRAGRVLLNYLLISAGYPPVILKGDDKNKDRYYRGLEQGDRVLREFTQKPFRHQGLLRAIEDMNTSSLEVLISECLRISLDRVLTRILEEQKGLLLKPAKLVAKLMNYSPDSMRTLISRGKFVAVKRGKEWMTHEELFLERK